MNMKKTIAAFAACAMAVSAMATTVSAVAEGATEEQKLHYDLTLKKKIKMADLTFRLEGVAVTTSKFDLYIPMSVVSKKPTDLTVTVGGKSYKFTTNTGSADYDGSLTVAEKDALDDKGNLVTGFGSGSGTVDGKNDLYKFTLDLATGNGKALGKVISTLDPSQSTIVVTMNDLYVSVDQENLNKALVAGAPVIADGSYVKGAIALTDGTNTFNARGAVKDVVVTKPMKTKANTSSETSEIFDILATDGSRDIDKHYENAKAVINDMIANYGDVVFTFNTAVDNVFTKAVLDANDKQGSWYTDATKREFTDYYVTGVPGADPSWQGDGSFKSFPQQLYNLFGDEGTGNRYSEGYVFNNLFNAALVANNNWTMNQSTITPFEYSKTSVSFDWSAVVGGDGKYVNPAQAIYSLQLATSSDWYWDSMDVTGYKLEAEDASSDAAADDDSTDLDEDTDTDADDDSTIDDDADVDADDDADVDADVDADDDADADADVDADADADADAADETTDANPGTGNAPIALAVIPVALAAAAVVAKKRG